jgi:hypothetical protein
LSRNKRGAAIGEASAAAYRTHSRNGLLAGRFNGLLGSFDPDPGGRSMFTLSLAFALSLCLPQEPRSVEAHGARPREHSPLALLPAKNTWIGLELAAPSVLGKHLRDVALLRGLAEPAAPELLHRTLFGEDPGGHRARRIHSLLRLGQACDQGFGIAWVLGAESKKRGPELVCLGASSRPKELRNGLDALQELFRPSDEAPEGRLRFFAEERPLARFPGRARVLGLEQSTTEGSTRQSLLASGYRGRHLALSFSHYYGSRERMEKRLLDVVELGLGFSGNEGEGPVFPEPSAQERAGVFLGRLVMHWRSIFMSEEHVPAFIREVMPKLGLDRFVGLSGELRLHQGTVQEHYELLRDPQPLGKPVSPFELFAKSDGGLRKLAKDLPVETLLAMRLSVQGQKLRQWIAAIGEINSMNASEQALLDSYAGLLLGRNVQALTEEALAVWPEKLHLSLALLAPQVGLAPQPVLGVDIGRQDVDTKSILLRVTADLEAFARSMAGLFGGKGPDKLEAADLVRSMGKGANAVHYVNLNRVLRNKRVDPLVAGAIGTPYLAITQRGSRIWYGLHPRALRKLHAERDAAESMLSSPKFGEHFPEESSRPLELWIDADAAREAMAPTLRSLPNLLGLLTMTQTPTAISKLDVEGLIQAFESQSAYFEQREHGLHARFRGNGLLSPILWLSAAHGMYWADVLIQLLPRG